MPKQLSMLVQCYLISIAATATAQNVEALPNDGVLMRGKSLAAWISQSKQGATLEDRHRALQVLRSDGLRQNREETLRAFTVALSAKEPTVQSLAAAGLRRAGRPTDPKALPKLVEIISMDLSAAKPSLKNTGVNHNHFGLATRVIRTLGEIGDARHVAALGRITENKQVHVFLRQLAAHAIGEIERRTHDTELTSNDPTCICQTHPPTSDPTACGSNPTVPGR